MKTSIAYGLLISATLFGTAIAAPAYADNNTVSNTSAEQAILSGEQIIASGECGGNLTWVLDDEGTLTIRGTGDMLSSVGWSSYKDGIKNVIIEDGVTSIIEEAFERCNSLKSIDIPDSVTSIGYGAFERCSSLESIVIPDGVPYIDDWTFYGCYSLKSIDIPDSVTSIGSYAFESCSSLTNIIIPDGVNFIGQSAFLGCSSLTNITIPDSVTYLHWYTFYDCTSLTSVTISDSVTTIDNFVFNNCISLKNITIPDSVTSIGSRVFNDCSSLTEVILLSPTATFGSEVFQSCPTDLILYGHANSTTQAYAIENGYTFVELTPITEPFITLTCTRNTSDIEVVLSEAHKGTLIAAEYDEDGRLTNVSLTQTNDTDLIYTIPASDAITKVMLWNSATGMAPLANTWVG